MPRIVQITDTHVTARGTLWKDLVDTGARMAALVQGVNEVGADLVVHSGDVVEAGPGPHVPDEYEHAADILAGLTAPLRMIPGNHDDRAAMREAFPGQRWTGDAHLNFSLDVDGLHVVGLDSVIEGETAGLVDAARLSWLKDRLDDRPTLIFLHHPPCPMDLPFMDSFGFDGADDLADVLAGHDILRLACGHVHADVSRSWAGQIVSAAEAASIQIHPDNPPIGDLDDKRPLTIGVEPLRLRIFDWGANGLSVKTVLADPTPYQPKT